MWITIIIEIIGVVILNYYLYNRNKIIITIKKTTKEVENKMNKQYIKNLKQYEYNSGLNKFQNWATNKKQACKQFQNTMYHLYDEHVEISIISKNTKILKK